jgi:hypothetical protein
LLILSTIGLVAAPAGAQTAPANAQAAPAQPKVAKKVVCKDVDAERNIGSRLAPTSKVCRTVKVQTPENARQSAQPQGDDPAR